MYDLSPDAYGLPLDKDDHEMRNALKAAIKELQKIPDMQTPKTKLKQVGKAIKIVTTAFYLYRQGEAVVAETLNLYLPYLLVKARIPRLQANLCFIERFYFNKSSGNKMENYKANLIASAEYISQFVIKQDSELK